MTEVSPTLFQCKLIKALYHSNVIKKTLGDFTFRLSLLLSLSMS